jgi:phosphatidate cytidylyltransferase
MNVYFFGFFYFGIIFGLFPLIKSYTSGLEPLFEKFPYSNAHWFLFMLVIPWVCDSAAYFGGKALGKHKFAPAISPKKTWEGAVSGMIFSVIAGLVFALTLLKNENIWFVLVVALLDGIFAQFGDLIESLIKRGAGVKDSSNLIPGHGGLFDRTDSLLVSAVIVFVSLLVKSYVG